MTKTIFFLIVFHVAVIGGLSALFMLSDELYMRIIIAGIGALYLFATRNIGEDIERLTLYKNGLRAEGEITKFEILLGMQGHKLFSMDYRFSDFRNREWNGHHEVLKVQARRLGDIHVGKKIDILYNEKDPSINGIDLLKQKN